MTIRYLERRSCYKGHNSITEAEATNEYYKTLLSQIAVSH